MTQYKDLKEILEIADIAYRSKMMYREGNIDHKEIYGMKKLFSTIDFPANHKVREHQHKGDVWINKEEQTIICASSGTRLLRNINDLMNLNKVECFLEDAIDNIRIMSGELPSRTKAILSVNEEILNRLEGETLSDWKIIYTGHCTGGNFATIGSIDMYLKNYSASNKYEGPEIKSIIFEGLGSNNQAKKLYDMYGMQKPENIEIEHIVVNNRDNLANLVCPILEDAKIYKIIVPNKHEATFEGTLGWVSDIISPVLEANKQYIKILQNFTIPFYPKILDQLSSRVQNFNANKNYEIKETKHSIIHNTCKTIYQNFINPFAVKCTKIMFPENSKLVEKIQNDGVIYSFLELFGPHTSASLRENIKSDDIKEINGIETNLSRLLDSKELTKASSEKTELCHHESNDLVIETKDSPIELSSEIIGCITSQGEYKAKIQDTEFV